MAKRLVITEKPSVARDVVAALGGFQEEEGYWESDRYLVTFAVGHLFELLAPEDLDPKYKRWTLDTLPIIPEKFELKPKRDHGERLKAIKKLLERDDVEEVINACDAGREGELIFREIVDYNQSQLPIKRLWLQSMTTSAIRNGFSDLKPGEQYRGLRDAAYCRTYSDWLIGMNATRALTRRLKTRSENQAWSAGRVQTPTLAMLVDRELEILSHSPVAYWKLVGTFAHGDSTYQGVWFDTAQKGADTEESDSRPDRIFDEAQARAILARITGKPGVASETRKPSKEAAPLLFDLTTLQREANRRFGWSARRTLNAAQRCYEAHKTLTYPRTDARALPNDYRPVVDEVIASLGADPRYSAACQFLGAHGLLNTNRIFDDEKVTDHFAIVPTGVLPERALEGDDARLFDLVVRRFLGAFHPPATWSRVERVTVVEGESFRSRARTLQDPGWRAVLGETESEEGDSALPPLVSGQDQVEGVSVRSDNLELASEETKPPPRITEGRLLSLMENAGEQVEDEEAALALKDKGIGTPATRADIIENLISKGYVVRAGKALRPSVKGIRLIDILHRMHAERLASPRLTGEMEQHLAEVEKKRRQPDAFMNEIRDYTREIVERTKTFEFDELYPDDEALGACPLCGKPVYERSWFYRCKEPPGLAESRRPSKTEDKDAPKPPPIEDCPFRIWKDKSGRYVDRTTVKELLATGKTRVLDGFTTRQGRTYRGQIVLENGELVLHGVAGGEGDDGGAEAPEYEVDDRPLGACPFCKTGEVVETRATFVCSKGRDLLRQLGRDEASLFSLKKKEVPEGAEYCTFLLPRTVCRREITREEAEGYVRDLKTPVLTDFISQRGRPFSATLFMRPETGRHGFEFPPRGQKGKGEGDEAKTAKSAKPARAPKKKSKVPATARAAKAGPKKREAKGAEGIAKAKAKPPARAKKAAKGAATATATKKKPAGARRRRGNKGGDGDDASARPA
ncbi:MAG: DNA topoisomerase 3 [Deltaproteobacteria bacterium]|nr:DNA topoisomerase 3 [Deltaproteobacteria bacterium]